MLQRRIAVVATTIATLTSVLAGCGGSDTTTTAVPTTTDAPVNTTQSATTTTTVEEVGAQPLPADGFVDPGDYFTTVFQPAVMYRIDSKPTLQQFQNEFATGFHSYWPAHITQPGIAPYKGVAVHNIWLGLTPEAVTSKLRDLEGVEFGETSQAEIGGYLGSQIDATVSKRSSLWAGVTVQGTADGWFMQPGQRMRFIVLETPAGTLLTTVSADTDEWDDFLPIAEEILAGISFPDL